MQKKEAQIVSQAPITDEMIGEEMLEFFILFSRIAKRLQVEEPDLFCEGAPLSSLKEIR